MKKTPLTETEQERAKVLHAGGKSANAIAKNLGRNRRTVAKFLDKPEVRQQVSVQREELAGMFDSVAHRVVSAVSDEDVARANLVGKLTAAGIAVDKASMLRGELPGPINVNILLECVQEVRRIRAQRQVIVIDAPPQLPSGTEPNP
jgi:hypothetical protein